MSKQEVYQCFCILCQKEYSSKGIYTHYLSKHTEYGIKHLVNAKKSRQKANSLKQNCKFCNENIRKANIKRHEISCPYNPENHTFCKFCNKQILERRKNFCDQSCAAKFNNSKKLIFKDASDEEIRHFREKIEKDQKIRSEILKRNQFCNISFRNCKKCNKPFSIRFSSSSKMCCSRECNINHIMNHPKNPHGNIKNYKYFNKYQDKIITLQSSWEVEIAEFMDKWSIKWIRPKYILWNDSTGKSRNYYPDFFLPDYNIYLDPKNPYCLKLDKEKLSQIEHKVSILYGNKDKIIVYLYLLKNIGPSTRESN